MIDFKKRLFENWTYPKIDKYEDAVEDRKSFMEFLNEDDHQNLPTRIYVHVPFCRSFCPFCPYYKVAPNDQNVETYVDAITKELKMYSVAPFYQGNKIDTICFGGGDPAVLNSKQFSRIMQVISEHFDISETQIVSVEGNVKNLLYDPDKVKCYSDNKVNRISFGIQTFKEELRKKMHLKPTLQEIYDTFELLRKYGFDDISIDLMYNLPDQTIDDICYDVEKAASLFPTYMDAYSLNLYPGTSFIKTVFDNETFRDPPSNQKSIEMYKHIVKQMKEHGYNQVASMCFSRTHDTPHVHLSRFIKNDPMIGVGPSSRSYVGGRSYRNITNLDKYIEYIANNEFPVEAGAELSSEQISEKMMVFFPILLKINKSRIENYQKYEPIINDLKEVGYLKEEGDILSITEEGKVWVPNIQRLFYNKDQRKKELQTIYYSAKYKENPYNQDTMGVSRNSAGLF